MVPSQISSSHVWTWELDRKECWALKNWCFWITVKEKTFWESLGERGDKPVNPKGNQPWIFSGRADIEAPLWPPDRKSQLFEKDPDAGKGWGQEDKWVTGEMVGWHHWLNGHEFEQTPGNSKGQGRLVCCRSWGHRVRHYLSDRTTTTELLFRKIFVHDTDHIDISYKSPIFPLILIEGIFNYQQFLTNEIIGISMLISLISN